MRARCLALQYLPTSASAGPEQGGQTVRVHGSRPGSGESGREPSSSRISADCKVYSASCPMGLGSLIKICLFSRARRPWLEVSRSDLGSPPLRSGSSQSPSSTPGQPMASEASPSFRLWRTCTAHWHCCRLACSPALLCSFIVHMLCSCTQHSSEHGFGAYGARPDCYLPAVWPRTSSCTSLGLVSSLGTGESQGLP